MRSYHLARTVHGSTLSALVHAWVLAGGRGAESVEHFRRALVSDVADIQGGTTAEGVHLGVMAGCVDLVQRCFAGLEIGQDTLWVNPRWPHRFERLSTCTPGGAPFRAENRTRAPPASRAPIFGSASPSSTATNRSP